MICRPLAGLPSLQSTSATSEKMNDTRATPPFSRSMAHARTVFGTSVLVAEALTGDDEGGPGNEPHASLVS